MVVLFFCPVPEQLPSTWHISAGLQEVPSVTNKRSVTPGWSSVGFWWLPSLKYTFSDPIRKSLVTKMFFGFCFLWCWNPQLDLGQSGRGYCRQGWVHTEFFRGSNRLWVLLNQTPVTRTALQGFCKLQQHWEEALTVGFYTWFIALLRRAQWGQWLSHAESNKKQPKLWIVLLFGYSRKSQHIFWTCLGFISLIWLMLSGEKWCSDSIMMENSGLSPLWAPALCRVVFWFAFLSWSCSHLWCPLLAPAASLVPRCFPWPSKYFMEYKICFYNVELF